MQCNAVPCPLVCWTVVSPRLFYLYFISNAHRQIWKTIAAVFLSFFFLLFTSSRLLLLGIKNWDGIISTGGDRFGSIVGHVLYQRQFQSLLDTMYPTIVSKLITMRSCHGTRQLKEIHCPVLCTCAIQFSFLFFSFLFTTIK